MSTIKPREAEVVIYQGDDLPRLAELRKAAEVARRHAAADSGAESRMGDDAPSASEAEDAYDAFANEAADRALIVKLRAIGRRRFRDLMAEHPPRDVTETDDEGKARTVSHSDDSMFEVNTATFPAALLAFNDGEAATIAAPDFPTTAARRRFIDDEIADGDFDELWLSAYYLNRSPGADPKASLYSTGSPRSSAT